MTAVCVAQLAGRSLADAGRVLASLATAGEAGRMPRIDLFRRIAGKADGAAIGRRCSLAVDRLRNGEHASLGDVEDAIAIDPGGPHFERAEQLVVERLGLVEVVGAD